MISSGFDRKILIEKPTAAQSGTGASTNTWTTHVKIRARRVDVSSREFLGAAEVVEYRASFEMRFVKGLNAKMRIKDTKTDEYFDIVSIKEVGREKGHIINAVFQDHGYNT